MSLNNTSAAIIGCGFLGLRLLEGLSLSYGEVTGTGRSDGRLAAIRRAGGRGVFFDINSPDTWNNPAPRGRTPCDLYVLVPPGQVDPVKLREFLHRVHQWPVRRMVISSSTVVYGTGERTVDADSPVQIDSKRAERQYAIERAFEYSGHEFRIARLAGLYGAERIIGRQAVERGETLPGNPDAWLNLIHVTDAAGLLITLMSSDTAAAIELGCDGRPVKRARYYRDLAEWLRCSPPGFGRDGPGRAGGGRRCDNRATCRRTGWRPRFTDYRLGWKDAQ